jgi:hypothetical protein
MTRSEIIELVKVLTERKLENVLNFNQLFTLVIQDFCGQNRFWWRQMSVAFSLVQGTAIYDTTSISATPDISQIAIEEITSVAIINQGSAPTELVPVFDPLTQMEMRAGLGPTGLVGQQAKPGRYMIDFNDFKTLRFDTPDFAYSMLMTFWGMPDPRTESADDSVPLVPPWWHRALVHGMEAEIWRSVYGPKNQKYVTAKQQYQADVLLAQARPRYTTNFSQQMIPGERSIQST